MHLVDGRDAFQSNWLRYVNCSKSIGDQNIRAVQYDGNIYYMATKQIEIGDELLTFYGEKFARILGIKTSSKKGASKDKGNKFFLLFAIGLFQKKSAPPDGWDSGNSRGRGVKDPGNPGRRGG